jgi:uncharacterized protein (TIGR03083 family)
VDTDGVWRSIDQQRARLADLFSDLTDEEWRTPSLCTAWTVREVAAHLTLAHMGLGAGLPAIVRARGSFDGMIRDTAIRRAKLPVEEYPRLLRAMIGSRRTAPFITEHEPLIDVLVHGQDMTRPLGRALPVPIEPAMAAADRVWSMSFPFRARRRLSGRELVAVDAPWRVGSGPRVEGPMASLLLLLTGRPAALADLTGPGTNGLATTFGRQVDGPSPAAPAEGRRA